MMKKFMALVLAMLMVLACLASCGSEDSKDKKYSKDDSEEAEEKIEDEEDDEKVEEETEKADEETEKADEETEKADEKDEPVEEDNTKYVYGTLSETSWKSEWIGLEFKAEGNYRMYTTEEILTLNGLTEAPENNDYNDKFAVYEMLSLDGTNGNNVLVMTEKLMGVAVNISMEDYIEQLKKVFSTTVGEGVNVEVDSEFTLGGMKWAKINVSYEMNGISMSQIMLLRKKADRMVAITVTDMTGSALDTIVKMFSAA